MPLRDDDALAARVGELLLARGARVAVAESTAGGLISARLVSVPGASKWFDRGIVAYALASKPDALGVSIEFLREHGAVGERAVTAIAGALRERAGVDYALAESGMAGPVRGRSPKPVGAVAIALAGPDGVTAGETRLEGSRAAIMEGIAERALRMLAAALGDGA